MSRGLRRSLVVAACAIAVLAVGYALVRGWSAVRHYDWNLEPQWVLAALVTLTLAYSAAAFAYARVVAALYPPAHRVARPLERAWTISLLGRYVPGNVLMVAGRMEMGHAQGIPRRVSVAASIYEQVLMLATSAMAGVLYLALYGDLGNHGLGWLLVLVPLIPATLHPRVFGPATSAVLRRFGREPLEILLSPVQTGLALVWYALVQGGVALGAWMLVRAAAGPAAAVGVVALGFLLAFTVSMLAFLLPSGLGVREGALALALAPVLPGGVAVAIAVGLRFAITVFELGFVAVVSAAWRVRAPDYPVRLPDDAR